MSKIFFPLRSNSAWFFKEETKHVLEKRIKSCLILYDEIYFQDALYICTLWKQGFGDIMVSPDAMDFDRDKGVFYPPGSKAQISIKVAGDGTALPLLDGEAEFTHQADFYPIIKDAGLLTADYIFLEKIDVPDDVKQKAKQVAELDAQSPDLGKALTGSYFFKQMVLQSLYVDSKLSWYMESPFVVDYNIVPAIQWKNRNTFAVHDGLIKDIFISNWIQLGLPDFSVLTWEEIDHRRNSSAGIDLRRIIDKVGMEVYNELPNISDYRDVSGIVAKHFTMELLRELSGNLPTDKGTLLSIGYNLIPCNFGALPSVATDVIKYVQYKRSWVSLIY